MTGPAEDTPAALKAALRRRMRALREAIPPAGRARAAQALPAHAGALPLARGEVVSAYWPMGAEIDVRPLLEALHARGHPLALPVVARGEPLLFRRWRPGDALVRAGFGTSEPAPDAPEVVPDLLLVPLLAFTRAGHRLGYGGGFYDRTLAALAATSGRSPRAVGVGYRAQEVDALPAEPHDVPLAAILTEDGLIEAAPRPNREDPPCG